MIKKIKTHLGPILLGLLIILGSTPPVLAADSVQLYVAPGSQTVPKNSSFSLAIRINTSIPIDYVHAYLRFPSDKLSVTGLTGTGSAFNYEVENAYDNNSGQIRVRRYSYTTPNPPPSGDLLVATVTFQAKNPGTAPINFEGSSSARNLGQDNVERLTASHGGSVTISAPPPPPPPVRPTPFPTTPRPTPPPVAPPPPPVPEPTPPDPSQTPLGEGVITVFRTKITIVRDDQKPIQGAEVTIDGNTQKTNNDGVVSFELPAGNVAVSVRAGSVTKEFIFTVHAFSDDPSAQPAEQNFTFVMPASRSWVALVLGGAALLAVVIVVLVLLRRRALNRSFNAHHQTASLNNSHDNREQKVYVVPPSSHPVKAPPPPIKLPKVQTPPEPKPYLKPKQVSKRADSSTKQSSGDLKQLHELKLEPLPHPVAKSTSDEKQPPILHHDAPHIDVPHVVPPAPTAPNPPKVSRTLPVGHHIPDWQLEVKKSLSKPATDTEFEEPKDMFEAAEEQFHYDEKFKKASKSVDSTPPSNKESSVTPNLEPVPIVSSADLQPLTPPPVPKVSRTLPPEHHIPDWQLEVKKSLSKPATDTEFEEPKDMFDNAEIQFHYDEKFKKTLPPTEPPTKK